MKPFHILSDLIPPLQRKKGVEVVIIKKVDININYLKIHDDRIYSKLLESDQRPENDRSKSIHEATKVASASQ